MRTQLPSARWDVLAGLRFVLAFIVLISHLHLFYAQFAWINEVFRFSAFTAVLCFLVISGYSISHSVANGTQGFYRRRFLRIYPLYLCALVATVAHQLLVPGGIHQINVPNLLGNVFFLQTFLVMPLVSNEVVWTLAVEVGCYLAAPLLCLAALSAGLFAAYPHTHWRVNYYAFNLHGEALLFLGWAWLAGFIFYRHRESQSSALYLLAAMVGLTTLNNMFTGPYQHFTILLTVLCLAGGGNFSMPAPIQKMLRFSGDLSFPLYLIHMPIFLACMSFHASIPVMLAASVGGAMLAMLIEPWLRSSMKNALDAGAELQAVIPNAVRPALVALRSRTWSLRSVWPESCARRRLRWRCFAPAPTHRPWRERSSGEGVEGSLVRAVECDAVIVLREV
jgi:peptidoglycan/LPS O-acetylase OafA/YrhL